MIGTDALGHGVIRPAVYKNVTALWVHHAVVRLAIDDDAYTDASAHCNINAVFHRLGAAPNRLTQGSGVDVGVKAHWHTQGFPEAPHHGKVPPLQLGRRHDVAIGRGAPVQIHWPKTTNAHRSYVPLPEKCQNLRHRIFRLPGGKAHSLQNFALRVANCTHHLRATGFQRAKMQHVFQLLFLC